MSVVGVELRGGRRVEVGQSIEGSRPKAARLAPHTGHISNLGSLNGSVIEPVGGHCFQSDPCELPVGVHGGHPVWTRLELARLGLHQIPTPMDKVSIEGMFLC